MDYFKKESKCLKNLINYIRMYNPLETWSSICGHLLCASYTDDADIFKFYYMWKEYKLNLPYKNQNLQALNYLEIIKGYSAKIFYHVITYLFTNEGKPFLSFLYTPFSRESYEQKFNFETFDSSIYFIKNKKIKEIKDKKNNITQIKYYILDYNEFNLLYIKDTFEFYLHNLTFFEHDNKSVFELHKINAERNTRGISNLENRKKDLNVLFGMCELLSYMNYLGKEKEIIKLVQKLKKKQCLYLFNEYLEVLEKYRNAPEIIDGRRKDRLLQKTKSEFLDILYSIKFDMQKRHNWIIEDYIYSFHCTYNPVIFLEEIPDGVSFVNEILQEYKKKLGIRQYPEYL